MFGRFFFRKHTIIFFPETEDEILVGWKNSKKSENCFCIRFRTLLIFCVQYMIWPLLEEEWVCKSFSRKSTWRLNSKTVPVLPPLKPSLIFPFQFLLSPVYPTGFSFSLPWLSCHFYLVDIEQQPSVSSLASLPFSSCCHRATT